MRFDPTLCLVLGPDDCPGRDVVDVARAAVAGGVTMVQLRWKDAPDAELLVLARRLIAALAVAVLVNDRADIAVQAGAAGVHVGQTDMKPAAARALLGPAVIVGLSIETAAQLPTIDAAVDYVGLGPLFATGTKPDHAPPLGVAGFAAIRPRIAVPVMAIGGVKASHASDLRRAGANGLAVVSAITASPDAREAAASLRLAFV